MSAYLVRVPNSRGTHDYGFFLASSLPNLYWAIDEWTDPNTAQYVEITAGAWIDTDHMARHSEFPADPGLSVSDYEWDEAVAHDEAAEVSAVLWREFPPESCRWKA